jgi:hypothetical protein
VHYRRVLARLGHEVRWVSVPGLGGTSAPGLHACEGFALGTNIDDLLKATGADWDLFLYIEPWGLIPEGIERAPFPTACVLCDTHLDLASRQRLARFFDHVFLYHRNYIPEFREHPDGRLHWLPYACDLAMFRSLGVERDLDVAFIGQAFTANGERSGVMARLRERWKTNDQRWYDQEEIPGVYSRARIVLNMPLRDDLNFRFFEALSCGALLLTRRIANGQELLFEENTHYVAYGDERELLEKVAYYLAHDDERLAIAARGHAEVVARHGLEARVETMLSGVRQQPGPAAPVRRMTPGELDREYAWLYEYWRSLDAGARIVGRARRSGRRWSPLMLPALRTFLRVTVR